MQTKNHTLTVVNSANEVTTLTGKMTRSRATVYANALYKIPSVTSVTVTADNGATVLEFK